MPYETTGTLTGMDVFQRAITIMDELNDAGEYLHSDTTEYLNRSLPILNTLQNELYPYSDTCPKWTEWQSGRRPVLMPIPDMETVIDLDDYCSGTVLPYGLVAHLLLTEDPNSAGFAQQRYDELKAALMRGEGRLTESEDIVDIYGPNGGIHPYNEFSMWS